MAAVLSVHILKNEITPFINGVNSKLPEELSSLADDISHDATRRLRMEVLRQRLIWRGNLLMGIHTVYRSKHTREVSVPVHGVMLDSMRPHFVALKRGRNITEWARTAQNSPYRGRLPSNLPRGIAVKAHPWINKPLNSTIRQVNRYIKRRLDGVIAR